MALFLMKSRNFRIFRKKKCGAFSPVFSKNPPLQTRSFFPFFWLFGGVGFLKKQVKPHQIFFSEKSENFAISSKKAPLSEPPNDDSPIRLPRNFGMDPAQGIRHPRDLQNAHFFHKNQLFCPIRTRIYVQNGQKPVFFSKSGVGQRGVSTKK